MEDVLFDNNGNLVGLGASDRVHQEDILVCKKGWNKFTPHIGVGVIDFIDDEIDAETLKSAITENFNRDGMVMNEIAIDENGKIYLDARYNS